MKNLLKASFFIFLIGVLFLTSGAKSGDTEVFLKVINNSGFKTDNFTSNSINFDSTTRLIKTNKNAFVETYSLPNSFFSKFTQELEYKILFFVCNSDYEEASLFKCSNNKVENLNPKNFRYEQVVLDDAKNDEKVIISSYTSNEGSSTIFVIPSSSFENNFKINLITDYLSSINKSSKVSVDNPNITEKTFSQNLDDYLKSTSLELFIYSIVTIFFALFVGKIIIYLRNNYKNLNFNIAFNLLEDFIFGSFSKNRYLKLFFISSITFYIILFLQFIPSYIGSKTVFLKQMVLNILEFNLFGELSKWNYDNVIFYSYTYFIIFLILVSRFDYLVEVIKNLFSKVKEYSVNQEAIKYTFIIPNILTTLLFISFNKFFSFEFLLYILLFNLFIGILLYKQKTDLFILFSLREKIIIVSSVIILSLGVFYYQNFSLRTSYKFENLIGVPDKIVSLPYKKQTSENVLFNNLSEYKINYPLFVDEFLIYHPNYSKYSNKNISKFDDSNSNYLVVSKTYERLVRGLLSNTDTIKNLESSSGQKLFFVNLPEDNLSQVTLITDLNCSYKTTNTFKVKIYYFEGTSFKNTEFILGNILGCNSESQRYTFKLPVEVVSQNNFMLELLGIDLRFVNSLKFELEDKESIVNFKEITVKNNFYYYVSSTLNPDTEITNYFVSDKKDVSFDNSNITENLNTLKRDKFIGNTFNIWSNYSYRIFSY